MGNLLRQDVDSYDELYRCASVLVGLPVELKNLMSMEMMITVYPSIGKEGRKRDYVPHIQNLEIQ